MLTGKIAVSSNANPDLDGFACALGLAEILQQQGYDAKALVMGGHQSEIDFVVKLVNDQYPKSYLGNFGEFDSIAIVDTSNFDTLKKGLEIKKLKLIIDHRMANDAHLYPDSEVIIEPVGSCATIIIEKYIEAGIEPSKNIALYLYGAIISNTINFRNNVTTQRDKKAAKYLKKFVDIPDDFDRKFFIAKSDFDGEKLKDHLEIDKVEKEINGENFVGFQIETVKAAELVADRINDIEKYIGELILENAENCYLNVIDTLDGYNLIYAHNKETEDLLEKALGVKFENKIAKTDHIIMRKEVLVHINQLKS